MTFNSANYVTSYDHEFSIGTEEFEVLNELGITILRFPGGSVTENVFTEASFNTGDWDANSFTDGDGNVTTLTTIASFIEVAGQIGADIQLVIPTRVAFSESAGQALFNGTFGERDRLDLGYLDRLDAYIDYAITEASANGVEISRFEIGNEFWGSGEMNASEYGF